MRTRGVIGYDAIVLAGGAGHRFGGLKQLAEWRGRPLVLAAVEAALAAPVDRVTVVLGAQAPEVETALKTCACARLHWVVADDWREGLAASLRAGIRRLPKDSLGVLVFLGDMPLIPADPPWRVASAQARGAAAVQPHQAGQPAHLVGFGAEIYDDILHLRGDAGAGALLRNRRGVVQLHCDAPGAAFDIDTPADLAAFGDGAPWRDYSPQQAGLS